MLSVDDLTSNYVVSLPHFYERQEDDWLLDIELVQRKLPDGCCFQLDAGTGYLGQSPMRKLVKLLPEVFWCTGSSCQNHGTG